MVAILLVAQRLKNGCPFEFSTTPYGFVRPSPGGRHSLISPVFRSKRPMRCDCCAVNHATPSLPQIIVWGSRTVESGIM